MGEAASFYPMMLFFVVGAIAIASSLLVVAMRNPVHSALFLLVTFLCVAVIFFFYHAEFVGAVQVLVYAGGIMVLFLFVVMLINIRDLPSQSVFSPYWMGAIAVGFAMLLLLAGSVRGGGFHPPEGSSEALRKSPSAGPAAAAIGNSEAVAMTLYREYLIPFEVASLFLLVAMVGAIIIGRRHIEAGERADADEFILERAAQEHDLKEITGA